MTLAALLLVVVACGPKATGGTGAATSTATSPSSGDTTGTTSSTATPTVSGAQPAESAKSSYSCFSYVTGNVKTPRHACMRTDDCGPYLEQAKSVGGIREVSGCASVQAVCCFHQVASKDEPEGLDICQPTWQGRAR